VQALGNACMEAAAVASQLQMKIGKLQISWVRDVLALESIGALHDSTVKFRCTVCGALQSVLSQQIQRETRSCDGCGSTVRFRSIALHLLDGMGFSERSLADIPGKSALVGIGLSDWVGYASLLAEKFHYTNTFFHTQPQLDIANPPDALTNTCDFVVSSDVFEHVLPPAINAFLGVAKILKPGGLLVFTVPFIPSARTVEHYPDAVGYLVDQNGGVTIETATGNFVANEPIFHGGPGSTLEMRVFGALDLHEALTMAGFTDIVFHSEANLEAGVLHRSLYSVPITARKRA
jgi:SAM-dependent methyltransferase